MKNLKEFLVFCLSTALSLSLLAACGKPQIPMAGAETPAEPSSAASEGSLRVMASFYPMYDFAQKIGGDKVTVTNMVPAGTEPHDWEPSPSDIVALEQADVFVYSGAGMEHWVEDVLASLDNQSLVTVEASYGIALLEGHHHHHEDEEEAEHEHEDEHEHEEEQAHGHAGHEHEENAHVWLSVPNAIAEVNNIAAGLKKLLPGNEAQIERNRSAYEKRLLSLDAELAQMLAPIRGAEIISFHEAYDYFAQRYGLVIAGAIETHDGGEPGTKELIETVERIRSHGIRAIFIEPNYQGSSAGILSRETGAKLCTLNPVTQGEDSLTAYEGIMRQNAKTIVEAVKNGD